jgi:hypothetical protein
MSTPLERRCYVMSESDGPNRGYRLIIGFESLDDLQNAHEYVARLPHPTLETSVCPVCKYALSESAGQSRCANCGWLGKLNTPKQG